MRVAICDDEKAYHKAIGEALEVWKENHPSISVFTESFCSSEELLHKLETRERFDIVFLDIEIPDEMNGLELARQIRLFDEYAQIVFVTNYGEYAYDGYEVNALRYLRKPILSSQIYKCMDITHRQWTLRQGASIVLADSRGKTVLLYKDILYIEAQKHNLLIYRTTEKTPFCFRMTLSKICEQLPIALFVLCHRSFVVNVLYIRRITRETLTLASGQIISIGKKYQDAVNSTFERYYRGETI